MTSDPILVFTPTIQFGGLDVSWSSLCRQTVRRRIIWAVADELLEQRIGIYDSMIKSGALRDVIPYRVGPRDGYPKTLTSSWNESLDMADQMGCSMHVCLQDYIWIPDDGVEKFERVMNEDPERKIIVAGLCGIADNPPASMVVDPHGLYTIFAEPYEAKPDETWWWEEVRGIGRTEPYIASAVEWEANWAAVPRSVYADLGIRVDPELDRGITCENQDVAFQCERAGYEVVVDPTNMSIGLPHKLYFEHVTESNRLLVAGNREYMAQKWGISA